MDLLQNGWVGSTYWRSACWCLGAWEDSKKQQGDGSLETFLASHILNSQTIVLNIIFLVAAPVVVNEEASQLFFPARNYSTIVRRFICECVKAQGNVGWAGGSAMLSVPLSVFTLAA